MIEKKTNPLGMSFAAHLLRRTCFSFSKTDINNFAAKTPSQALDDLFNFSSFIRPSPLNNFAETFIPSVEVPDVDNLGAGTKSNVRTWLVNEFYHKTDLQPKLMIFLHLMFITNLRNPNAFNTYDAFELFRFGTTSSFKKVATKIVRDIAMLNFLDNRKNKVNALNENFAREFLELFTILKGPQIGPDNYTNYTEDDVKEAAKVFTGFTITTNNILTRLDPINVDSETNIPRGRAKLSFHDISDKTFSSAFDNTTIQGGSTNLEMEQELDDFINMIFEQIETARAYTRRLYRYFVGREISSETETSVIEPLAQMLFDNDYDIEIVVKEMLTSKHFYDELDNVQGDQIIGSLVRSPFDLIIQMHSLLEFDYDIGTQKAQNKFISERFVLFSDAASFKIFDPVNVNGYAAYSTAPKFDLNWISSSTILARYQNSIDALLDGVEIEGTIFELNIASFVENSGHFDNPEDHTLLIRKFFEIFFVEQPIGERYIKFENQLLDGLDPMNWYIEWTNYITTGIDTDVRAGLNRFVKSIIKSPEFQIF